MCITFLNFTTAQVAFIKSTVNAVLFYVSNQLAKTYPRIKPKNSLNIQPLLLLDLMLSSETDE